MQTERRMPNAITFLGTYDSYPLKHGQEAARDGKTSRSGQSYLTTDPAAVLRRGKIAFADNCAQCHSSKRPADLPSDPELRKGRGDSLFSATISSSTTTCRDDERYPVSELGTNAARAMGTNALAGHMWGQMSSITESFR